MRSAVRLGGHPGEDDGADALRRIADRAARICSAAHGGQVLVSRTTRELVAGALPGDDVTLRDLGPRALRDLVRPEHLFEVVTD